MPNELLYSVAKQFGWNLTNGNQYKDLWEADDLFGKLMGNNVEARRNFIQKFALEAKIDS